MQNMLEILFVVQQSALASEVAGTFLRKILQISRCGLMLFMLIKGTSQVDGKREMYDIEGLDATRKLFELIAELSKHIAKYKVYLIESLIPTRLS